MYIGRVTSQPDLLPTLRRFWGYTGFRPLQERIAHSLLAGHDTCVVMPTGGGKSLCYQLPAALLSERTAVVVSPLIALMQDQVTQLTQMGIPAALLNSTLTEKGQSQVVREVTEGRYRLLYLSPERLARADTIEWLRRVPVSFFAIDEAHCISEWGHEFRPDYRQLSRLRAQFPENPIAAFTASATRHVRHDIIAQLQLRSPHKYIASFHRPNLRYVVHACDAPAGGKKSNKRKTPAGQSQMDLLVRAIRSYPEGNIIVYAPTIARVESTALELQDRGIPATVYHGQMPAAERQRNQERWMLDEVRVLVGTIAFGLGINKAAVRAVIHLSLPKSVEPYYQEAGRAGRDGLPADCVLLWQKRDAGLLAHFIEQIVDPAEKQRAWQRYHEIRDFVESTSCRHRQICLHFGETPKWHTCEACDVCGSQPDWLATPKPTPLDAKPQAAPANAAAGNYSAGKSPAGKSLAASAGATPSPTEPSAKQGSATTPPRTYAGKSAKKNAASDVDPELRAHLRQWRLETSKAQSVPAFVVLHDTTLDEICRRRPTSIEDLLEVSGIGERKAELYGAAILEALRNFSNVESRRDDTT